jgi:hypothetical protein
MSLSPAWKNKSRLLRRGYLFLLISLVLLLNLTIGVANATYTDYIGAGHDAGVTVTACSVDEAAIGQKTVDGSGLSGPSGTHSTAWIDHWLAFDPDTNPNPARSSYDYWIKYDFGEPYNLADMWVWNYNEDGYTDRGLNHVYIDYSTDGSSWSQLGGSQFQFPQASGLGSYAGFAGPDFAGATARYVLISVVDHWGGDSYGLAEVKFNVGAGDGGTVGNTSVFGNTVGASTRRAMPFTMPENGTIQSVSMYHGGYGGQVKDMILGVYTGASSPGARIGVTAQTAVSKSIGWQTIDLTSPVFVAGGTKIWLAWVYENNVDIHYEPGTPGRADSGVGWAGGMPDPFGASTTSGNIYSIYATYTSGGGPPDANAPTPNPSTWASVPSALSHTAITMTATTATDASGVQYYFEETTGNFGGDDSSWQASLDGPGCAGHPSDCADLDQKDDGIGFDDYDVLAGDWQVEGLTLLINEFMASNDSNKADPQGEFDDWIEIYNPTGVTIDMAGMYLEDSGNSWRIPDNKPGETIILSGGYLLIWADNDVCDTPGLHAGFQLNADGDEIRLYAADGFTLMDSISFEEQFTDISYGRYPDGIDNWFNMTATPSSTNTIGMAGAVWFSHPEGTFVDDFNLGLTTESPTADIYYTLDGSEPDNGKIFYTGLIPITQTEWVRARAYESGLVAGPITSKPYIKLHSDVADFNSNLPIVVIDTFGYDVDSEWDLEVRPFRPVISSFIDTDELTGLAAITGPADYAGYGGMHVRGSSTAEYEKKQYRFETWGEYDQDKNVSLLGLPRESDWIIHGPYSDKTLMRNYQMYTWSNLIGRYASRTRFIEVFSDQDGDGVIEWGDGTEGSGTDYRGIYVLMEKIKRDNDRVDIERLTPLDVSEPDITGGYLFEKGGGNDVQTATYGDSFSYSDPEPGELTTAQKTWVTNYFNATGYAQYIDVLSFVDHHILVELAKNVDGFLLSTYLFKDRLGKINMGPIWDYNGSLGGADYICNWDPNGWLHQADDAECCPTETCCIQDSCWRYRLSEGGCEDDELPNHYRWYERLFEDPEFLLKYADRWFDLREDLFSTTNMIADINDNVVALTTDVAGSDPVERNYNRWLVLESELWPNYYDNCWASGATYMDYVNWMKSWLTTRLNWMDSAIDANYGDTPPVINLNGSPADQGGYANVGDSVTITGGTIYYTLDGNDPRNHGGGTYGSLYSGSIPLDGTEQIKARIRYSTSDWSALNEAIFAVTPIKDNLRITEIMYHPPDANDGSDPNTEFIELKNIGPNTLNLNLVSFTDGIDFTFPDINLAAGDYVVVVEDQTAFGLRYPSFSGTIAGEYTGKASNAGERIELCDALGQTILNFGFKDGWYVITDGNDFSLNIIDPCDPDPNHWEYKEYWQASSVKGGSPGQDYTANVTPNGAIVINEVLTHTDEPVYGDWIELHNTTDANINIGSWFISDDRDNLKKYEVQLSDPRATVSANGYVVFNAVEDFRNLGDPGSHFQFGLNELGETVYLSSGSGGELAGGYCIDEDFKAAENDVTFGRYIKSPASANDVDFVAMANPTKGYANSDPNVGPVVISEIMYHPVSNGYAEYIELRNITASTVALYDPADPNNTWLFTDEDGGIEYYFPTDANIPASGYLLLVKNLVAFEAEFGSPSVTAFEWASGRLSNAGEKIELRKPGDPEPDTYFVPHIRVDRVNYSDGSHFENFHELPGDPWPTSPDGSGDSLNRIVPANYGNDVANWQAASPTPGY